MGKLIWLAGYPKSGTTWLRAFLHNFLIDPDEPYDINELSRLCTFDSSGFRYEKLAARPVSQLSKEEVAQLRPQVHQMMTEVSPDDVFAKTHNALVIDRGTPMISMDLTAGGIYVVRNPLDVLISLADHLNMSIDDAIDSMAGDAETPNVDAAAYEFRGTWSRHVASWTGRQSPALHVVRYEDMLQNPVDAFGKVCRFLGINPPEERLRKAIRFSDFSELSRQEGEKGFTERQGHEDAFFRSGKADSWRDVLTRTQAVKMINAHRDQMNRFGYVPLGY